MTPPLDPQPLTPEEIADLVQRVRENGRRAHLAGIAHRTATPQKPRVGGASA